MKTLLDLHQTQKSILKKLLFTPTARFSEINESKISTDQFNFHLKALIDSGLVNKNDNDKGGYSLTEKGKEFANRFDTESMILERQAKVTVVVGCKRVVGDKTEYLVSQRKKNPYFDYHGYITGKIRWGETVLETAKREILEETGLEPKKLKLVGVEHKMDYSQDGQLLEDKFFFVIIAKNFVSEKIEDREDGKCFWVEKDKIEKLPKIFDDMVPLLEMFEKEDFVFSEPKYTVKEY